MRETDNETAKIDPKEAVYQAIRDKDENNEGVTFQEIVDENIPEHQVTLYVDQLMKAGEIFEFKPGKYKVLQ